MLQGINAFLLRLSVLMVLIVGINEFLVAQCQTPFGVSFEQKTRTSVDFRWTDPNQQPLGWDVEIVVKGTPPVGIPTNTQLITLSKYKAEGLESSTFYEIYVRTQCSNQQFSPWNGPFVVSTALANPTRCSIDLDLKDNGTETFLIDVSQEGILGQSVFISSVEMIAQHDWPADLRITLTNPSGKSTMLSNYHGTGGKHFGIPDDVLCFQSTKFSDQACIPLIQAKPPFNGNFIPVEPLHILHDNSPSKGMWRLSFHDRAVFQRGELNFFKIQFTEENCQPPTQFYISDVNSNESTVIWKSNPPCQSVKITLNEVGKPADQEKVFFLNCQDEHFVIPNLLPETEYEVTIQSICGISVSLLSCPIIFRTKCKPISLAESFNSLPTCVESCLFKCNVGLNWHNASENEIDWIVWQGKTATENTGPDDDISGGQKYIYSESQPDLCGFGLQTSLISGCMDIKSNADGCDFSFYYHMKGSGIGTLLLDISLDNGLTWNNLWQKSGHQGNEWLRALISLLPYHNQSAIFKFTSVGLDDILGDIALDQLEFYGSTLQTNGYTYYQDNDGDTYGNVLQSIQVCMVNPPSGYVTNNIDCDDTNALIHPGGIEILCNLVDENCNGGADDIDTNSDLAYTSTITHEACKGENNGKIDIEIMGGIPPYFVTWNRGETGEDLTQIGQGIYFCTITDSGGCSIRTNFIEVLSLESIQFVVTGTVKPSCLGKMDGKISINHSGGQPPFNYSWSNGSTFKDIEFISEGIYSVTIEDKNGCRFESQPITLTSNQGIVGGPTFVKNPSCFNKNDGQIIMGAINGSPPYQFHWASGHAGPQLQGIGGGLYQCTVTDSVGCQAYFQTTLVAPDTLKSLLLTVEPVRCFGEKNGIIKTVTTGGSPPYLYFWSHSAFDDDVFDLQAGGYSMTVTDKNSCSSTLSNILVKQPSQLTSFVDTMSPARCILGENGKISLMTNGGTAPYHYSWNSFTFPDTSKIDNIKTGVYSVIVFDELGCKFNLGSIHVPFENIALDVQASLVDKNLCFGQMNGIISAEVKNGNGPFDYNWSNGVQRILPLSNDTIRNLASGVYKVTVTDREGCLGGSNFVLIPFIPELTYKVESKSENICLDDSSGALVISVDKNQGKVNVVWNNGLHGLAISDLSNGLYTATVTDSVGCILQVNEINITSQSNLQVLPHIFHATTENNNGSFCLSITGEVGAYAIIWDEKIQSFTHNCASNLSPGTYTVTVTDSLGCSEEITIMIMENVATQPTLDVINVFYPNPTTDFLFVLEDGVLSNVEIYHTSGVKASIEENKFHHSALNISFLPSGMYIIKGRLDGKYFIQKIIKL
ncbi:MAG: T9SS type A sorting domain-containing protein [Saprospiraceae bacterium]